MIVASSDLSSGQFVACGIERAGRHKDDIGAPVPGVKDGHLEEVLIDGILVLMVLEHRQPVRALVANKERDMIAPTSENVPAVHPCIIVEQVDDRAVLPRPVVDLDCRLASIGDRRRGRTEVEQEEDRDTFVDPAMAQYGAGYGLMDPSQRQEPETIDFRTGAVFVDAVPVDGWTGGKRLRSHSYHTMLYSIDQSQIMKMPVGRPNWPEALALAYNKAKQFQKEPVEDFRDFGSSLVRSTRGGRGGAEMGLYGDMPMMNPGR